MTKISKQRFAKKIKQLRKDSGFTQAEMAELLGISRPAYTQYEKMQTLPSLPNFLKLASFFDVSVSELTGDEGDAA